MSDQMHLEVERLTSFFEAPEEVAANAPRLAASGFYYKGHDDRVKCFCCQIEFCCLRWQPEDDPLQKHKEWKPECIFITNPASSENVPAIPNGYISLNDVTQHQNIQDEHDELLSSMKCKVCQEHIAEVQFLPCCHIVTCSSCTEGLQFCPIETCCKQILSTTKQSIDVSSIKQR